MVLCRGVLCGWDLYLCILLPPGLFLRILRRPHLCLRMMDGLNVSVLFRGPGTFRSLCRGMLNGLLLYRLLYGCDLCLRPLSRLRLEFREQGFR